MYVFLTYSSEYCVTPKDPSRSFWGFDHVSTEVSVSFLYWVESTTNSTLQRPSEELVSDTERIKVRELEVRKNNEWTDTTVFPFPSTPKLTTNAIL